MSTRSQRSGIIAGQDDLQTLARAAAAHRETRAGNGQELLADRAFDFLLTRTFSAGRQCNRQRSAANFTGLHSAQSRYLRSACRDEDTRYAFDIDDGQSG